MLIPPPLSTVLNEALVVTAAVSLVTSNTARLEQISTDGRQTVFILSLTKRPAARLSTLGAGALQTCLAACQMGAG